MLSRVTNRHVTAIALTLVISLVATSCTSDGNAGIDSSSTTDRTPTTGQTGETDGSDPSTLVDTALGGVRGVQDFIIHLDLAVLVGDEPESFYEDLLDVVEEDASESIDLTGGFTWSPVNSLEGRVVDRDGEVLPSLDLSFGLLGMTGEMIGEMKSQLPADVVGELPEGLLDELDDETSRAEALVELTTPDFEQARVNVMPGDMSDVDLTFIDQISPGDTLQSLYLFGQTFPDPETQAEANLTPSELFAHRWNLGLVRFVGSDGEALILNDSSVQAVEGSTDKRQHLKNAVRLAGTAGGAFSTITLASIAADRFNSRTRGNLAVLVIVVLALGALFGFIGADAGVELNNMPDDPKQCSDARGSPAPAPGENGSETGQRPGGVSHVRFDDRSFDVPHMLLVQASSSAGCGTAGGDIHVRTIDGLRYDNQAVGEFLVYEGGDAVVQLRTEQASSRVSYATAVAARIDGHEVSLHPGEEGGIWIDDQPIELSFGEARAIGDGVLLNTRSGWTIFWGDGTVAWVKAAGSHLRLSIRASGQPVSGMFGDADGNPENDLVTRGGDPVAPEPDFETLYETYIDSWRISSDESLFHYAAGESTETFQDISFPPGRVTIDDLDPDDREMAEAACTSGGITDPEVLEDCILDVGLTGDLSYVTSAALDQITTGVESSAPAPSAGASTDWVVQLDDSELAEPVSVADGSGHVLVHASDSDGGVLVALDAADGAEAWRLRGVDTVCPALPLEDGRIAAVGERGGPLAPEDVNSDSLVIIDAESGDVLTTTVPDLAADQPAFRACRYANTRSGSVALFTNADYIWAWDVSTNDPTLSWSRFNRNGNRFVSTVSDRIVIGIRDENEDLAALLVDADSGKEIDRAAVPGSRFESAWGATVSRGEWVVMTTRDSSDDITGHHVALQVQGDSLETVWTTTVRRDAQDDARGIPELLRSLASFDDVLVGHASGIIYALNLTTGSESWTYDLPADRGTIAPAATSDRALYDGTGFGGPFVLAISPTGDLEFELSHDEVFGPEAEVSSADTFGPVLDDRLIVTASGPDGAPVVVAVTRSE